jgi:squalene-associated FAD-dependent desaturase
MSGLTGTARATETADVVVVGAGLAGITAALDLADAGRRVLLVERRGVLGGLTRSFRHGDREIDNGQHVHLRCCSAYRGFLERIGSANEVTIQPRLSISARRVGGSPTDPPTEGRIQRSGLPAPLHLAASLARYRHLRPRERASAVAAAVALRRVRLDDPRLDDSTFAAWLAAHGQSAGAVEALWDLITVATVNLPSSEASLTLGAMVIKTGLLEDPAAADIGWATVPLGTLHGARAASALADAGVTVRCGCRVVELGPGRGAPWSVQLDHDASSGRPCSWVETAGVVLAVPHDEVARLLPPGSVRHQDRLADLGFSAIVNVHVLYDRRVTDEAFFAALGTTAHWVFDRTASSGHAGPGQYLAVTVSAADRLLGRRPEVIAAEVVDELAALLPPARSARVLDVLVTKERHATFRAVPGTAMLRPGARTRRAGLVLAGAWTDTGWPATMEGAVRSGHAAARVLSEQLGSPDADQPGRLAARRPHPPTGQPAPTDSAAGAHRPSLPEEVA